MLHGWKHVREGKRPACWVLLLYFFFYLSSAGIISKFTKMIPNGYLIFEDESFLDSTVAKMNALRKSGQFCDVRLQVWLMQTHTHIFSEKPQSHSVKHTRVWCTVRDKMTNVFMNTQKFERCKMSGQPVILVITLEVTRLGMGRWLVSRYTAFRKSHGFKTTKICVLKWNTLCFLHRHFQINLYQNLMLSHA